jgi:hypothetical protein
MDQPTSERVRKHSRHPVLTTCSKFETDNLWRLTGRFDKGLKIDVKVVRRSVIGQAESTMVHAWSRAFCRVFPIVYPSVYLTTRYGKVHQSKRNTFNFLDLQLPTATIFLDCVRK